MERLRLQHRFYSKYRKKHIYNPAAQNFQHEFPEMADWLRKRQLVSDKNQVNTLTHWLILILFGLLTWASFPQQLLAIIGFTLITSFIKGPIMILLGVVYSFLIGLFPPLGILLSALCFFVSLYQLTRNWHMGLTAAFFYLYPLLLTFSRQANVFERPWIPYLATAGGLLLLHKLLKSIYIEQPSSKAVAWSLISLPYDCLFWLIPTKKRVPKKTAKKVSDLF